jgi:membrane-associated phospholipid phosphatase
LKLVRTLDGMPRRPTIPLLWALLCALSLALTGVLAALVPVVRLHDTAILQGFVALDRPRVEPLASLAAHLADPVPYALIGFALAAVAAARGRARIAVAIPLVLMATGATSQALKQLMAHSRFEEWLGASQIPAAAWPSGHATAAMTLALCGIIAAPAALRPLAAFAGGAFAIAVSYAILILGWHFPSDVLGGYLVAATWICLAVAALSWLEGRRPQGESFVAQAIPVRVLAAPAVAGGLLAASAIALTRPNLVRAHALDRPTFVFGAVAIAALAAALAGGLSRALSAERWFQSRPLR